MPQEPKYSFVKGALAAVFFLSVGFITFNADSLTGQLTPSSPSEGILFRSSSRSNSSKNSSVIYQDCVRMGDCSSSSRSSLRSSIRSSSSSSAIYEDCVRMGRCSSSISSAFACPSAAENTIRLCDVAISSSNVVTVRYSKRIGNTCAHLVLQNNKGVILHVKNLFCSDDATYSGPLSEFIVPPFAPGISVLLCHGNNYNLCSEPRLVRQGS